MESLIHLDIEALPEGGYVVTSPDVPGLVAQGRTIEETVEIARDVARKIIESCIENGDPLPEVFRRETPGPASIEIPIAIP